MKNFKEIMKTEDFVNSITCNTEKAIDAYKNHNNIWKTYVTIANYQLRALCFQGITDTSVFSQAWDELMAITGFKELYGYPEISEFISKQ